jgi:hypothetical protein
VAPSTLGQGAQQSHVSPPMRSFSNTNTISRATRDVTLVDVMPGRCKFSGFTVVHDEVGNEVRKQIGINDGYLKLHIMDAKPDEPNRPANKLYMRFVLKEFKCVLQIGPDGLEEKNSQTKVLAKLSHGEHPNEISPNVQSVTSDDCFLTTMDGMYVLEDMKVTFEGSIKMRIEGSACWRPWKGTTDEDVDSAPVPKAAAPNPLDRVENE